MLLLNIVLCFVCSFAVVVSSLPVDSDDWTTYKNEHGKVYSNFLDDSMRKAIFTEKKKMIEKFNQRPDASYKLGLNHMSDWLPSELKQLNGYRPSGQNRNTPEAEQYLNKIRADTSPILDELDWREQPSRVTSVKNQGKLLIKP